MKLSSHLHFTNANTGTWIAVRTPMKRVLLYGCLVSGWLVSGCAPRSLEVPFDPSQAIMVETGLYDLTVETVDDSCTPSFVTGAQPPNIVTVSLDHLGVSVPIPGVGPNPAVSFFELLEQSEYASHDHVAEADCGVFESVSARLTTQGEGNLEVHVIDQPTGNAACLAEHPGHFLAACSATRTIRYDFLKSCQSPVRVIVGSGGQVDCM